MYYGYSSVNSVQLHTPIDEITKNYAPIGD